MDQGLQGRTDGGVCKNLHRALVLLHPIQVRGLRTRFQCNNPNLVQR